MNVSLMNDAVTREAAQAALREYKQHRDAYDKRDWEIERIYRQIAKGKTVISVHDAIRRGGVDQQGRPRLAIMRADQDTCLCECWQTDNVIFSANTRSRAAEFYFKIPWNNRAVLPAGYSTCVAKLPRVPPQHRPVRGTLTSYHILWQADWQDLPRDPYLLKRIGKDAWVVLAAWDLTEVELSVLRAHEVRQ